MNRLRESTYEWNLAMTEPLVVLEGRKMRLKQVSLETNYREKPRTAELSVWFTQFPDYNYQALISSLNEKLAKSPCGSLITKGFKLSYPGCGHSRLDAEITLTRQHPLNKVAYELATAVFEVCGLKPLHYIGRVKFSPIDYVLSTPGWITQEEWLQREFHILANIADLKREQAAKQTA